ncbi:MAG: hypothetical protein D6712_17825 [Chloroflexi bacterium]|nr:MAG: hypothetical protein D6712_17825 [Chloroflexota bacterium]
MATVTIDHLKIQLKNIANSFTDDELAFHLERAKADESVLRNGDETRFNVVLHAAEVRVIEALLNNFDEYWKVSLESDMTIDKDALYKNLLSRQKTAILALNRAIGRDNERKAELQESIWFAAI